MQRVPTLETMIHCSPLLSERKILPPSNQMRDEAQRLREREHFLELFKIQVDNILPWVADGVPICIDGFLCLNPSPFLALPEVIIVS